MSSEYIFYIDFLYFKIIILEWNFCLFKWLKHVCICNALSLDGLQVSHTSQLTFCSLLLWINTERILLKEQGFFHLSFIFILSDVPLWAGVLTQGAGHFTEIIKNCPAECVLRFVVYKTSNVGPLLGTIKKKNQYKQFRIIIKKILHFRWVILFDKHYLYVWLPCVTDYV